MRRLLPATAVVFALVLTMAAVLAVSAAEAASRHGVVAGRLGPAAGHGAPQKVLAPGRPTDVTARRNGTRVILHWSAPKVTPKTGAATDYKIIWTAPPIMPLIAVVDTHSASTSYDSQFGPGGYQVVAKNVGGEGPPSCTVTVGADPSS